MNDLQNDKNLKKAMILQTGSEHPGGHKPVAVSAQVHMTMNDNDQLGYP